MKKQLRTLRALFFGVFLFAFTASWAQNSPSTIPPSITSPATSTRAVAQVADPSTLLLAAEKVIQLIDQGLASQLWRHVSTVTQEVVAQEEFASKIYAVRRPLGVVVNRRWATISQVAHAGSESAPPGLYVMVTFITAFEGRAGVQEQVSFRQDEDGIWRIAGYVIR